MNIVSVEHEIISQAARHDLAENLGESKEYREAFVEESVYTLVAFQIRAIREGLKLSQKEFGKQVGMAQERVSILEDPNAETKPTITTLLRIANGVDCGLDVRFIPFSRVLNNSFNNGPAALRVPGFEEERASQGEDAERLALLVQGHRSLRDAAAGRSTPTPIPINSSPHFDRGMGSLSSSWIPPASQMASVDSARGGSR